ncbi:hypothetical protein F5887DRAFT_915759 [Amanita rubescens]|nr:hypothetical protein F5887DRAFT_915759 [Amanita rubescens]
MSDVSCEHNAGVRGYEATAVDELHKVIKEGRESDRCSSPTHVLAVDGRMTRDFLVSWARYDGLDLGCGLVSLISEDSATDAMLAKDFLGWVADLLLFVAFGCVLLLLSSVVVWGGSVVMGTSGSMGREVGFKSLIELGQQRGIHVIYVITWFDPIVVEGVVKGGQNFGRQTSFSNEQDLWVCQLTCSNKKRWTCKIVGKRRLWIGWLIGVRVHVIAIYSINVNGDIGVMKCISVMSDSVKVWQWVIGDVKKRVRSQGVGHRAMRIEEDGKDGDADLDLLDAGRVDEEWSRQPWEGGSLMVDKWECSGGGGKEKDDGKREKKGEREENEIIETRSFFGRALDRKWWLGNVKHIQYISKGKEGGGKRTRKHGVV